MRVTDRRIASLVQAGPAGDGELVRLAAEKLDVRIVAALGESEGARESHSSAPSRSTPGGLTTNARPR
jgi:hypothetical protein